MAKGHLSLHIHIHSSSATQIFSFQSPHPHLQPFSHPDIFLLGPRKGMTFGWVCMIYGHLNESLHARREDPFSPPLDLMHFSYLVNLLMVL